MQLQVLLLVGNARVVAAYRHDAAVMFQHATNDLADMSRRLINHAMAAAGRYRVTIVNAQRLDCRM